VGNAIPAIKSIADRVTDTNEENGVANFLKKYFYL
jgi:hydroxymethylpyrimidine pyrophosphatase-like HAD family hydrolase